MNTLEIIGYVASVLVAISLMMSSIIKLRWYNLIGALLMSLYGFLLHSYPVGLLNLFIGIVDIYFLLQIYTKKSYFQLLTLDYHSEYLKYFLEHHGDEIKNFFPDFIFKIKNNQVGFFILRDAIPAGLFIAEEIKNELVIELDYAIPEYRDFQLGKFLYPELIKKFENSNIKAIKIHPKNKMLANYLVKIGFETIDNKTYYFELKVKND
jgi:hypothetical protein